MRTFYLAIIATLFATAGFAQTQTQSYTTAGDYTWVAPCGVSSITVECWGGGGAGGGANNGNPAGSGGAGGAYAKKVIAVTPGTSYAFTVGDGGAGTNSTGNTGGSSSFNTNTVLALGGAGGVRGGTAAVAGTITGSIGDTRFRGGNGSGAAAAYSGGGGGGAGSLANGGDATTTTPGAGGNAGGGAGGARITGNSDGNNGNVAGGGGSGARRTTGTNSGGNGAAGKVVISYTGISTYCIPSFVTDVEPITLVNFSNINNATSNTINGTPQVETFCNTTGTVTQGLSYTMTVKGNTNDLDVYFGPFYLYTIEYTDYFRAFIDWNQDGDFDDANEQVDIGSIKGSSGVDSKTATVSITVPTGATLGNTKMRIVKNYNAYSAACDVKNYGQAEDYVLNIVSACTASVAPTGVTTSATTVCSGTQITLKQTGGTLSAGYKWHWYSGSCGGTAVGVSTAADASLTFTPSATATYYVRAEEGCAANSACNATGVTVTVNNAPTITLTSGSTAQTPCINGTFASIVYTVGGGATGAALSGQPTGISGTYNSANKTFTIAGSPSQSGSFSYTVTTTGAISPCVNASLGGTIVVAPAPTSVSYTTSVIYCTNNLIAPNNPSYTGGAPTNYLISPTLPLGLGIDAVTGVISGTPTAVTPATSYTITASNSCGFTTGTVNIRTTAGANLYTISPNGSTAYCASGTGVAITLPASQAGVSYQLYRGATPVGTAVPGTGTAIGFGNQTVAGTYTIQGTIGSCPTTMNGQAVISITPLPTTTFTYPAYSYCGVGTTSPTITGAPQTGTFSASPSGLSINAATGVIDLGTSSPNTYSITYTVPASGGCTVYTSVKNNFVVNPSPVVYDVFGGGSYCSGGAGVEIGLSNSQLNVNYQLLRGVTLVATLAGTGTDISFGNQTVAGTYTIKAITAASPNCSATMNGSATVTVNPLPSAIAITPVSKTICQNTIQSLEASYSPSATTTGNTTETSGTINLQIADNDDLGASSTLRVTGVPVGATITSIVVNFSATHAYDGDLVFNLKGPNGNVLNLANRIGGGGNNFTNTNISSISATSITTASAPFTGTYAPQAASGIAGATIVPGNVSGATTFGDLYGAVSTSANGNWTLSGRDKALFDGGTLKNWSITINYTYISNPVTVTWTPATDLYTNPGATTPYTTGASAATVYAKPSLAGTSVYTATLTNGNGCKTTATSTLNVSASPTIIVSANYCDYPGKVRITATSDVPVPTSSWTWSGGLTGTNTSTTSYVDVLTAGTYYVSAQSTANGCPGTGVMSIAQELIINGDFEAGNASFTSDYTYRSNTVANNITTAGQYSVHNDPNFLSGNFWGTDHTIASGEGNFLVANGVSGTKVWKQTVNVIPNTDYYFSAYGVALNASGNYSQLQFKINNVATGSIGTVPAKVENNNPGTWARFFGTWNSGSNTTVEVAIFNNRSSTTGNDFGLDDISFGTLSTFLNLSSVAGSDAQSGLCAGTPITDITYEVGGDGNAPNLTGTLPPGVTAFWNGRTYKLSGTPTAGGTFNYTLTSTGCNPKVKTGTIVITQPSSAGTVPSLVSACYSTGGTISTTSPVGTIQNWQTSADGNIWNNTGTTTATYNYPALTTANFYRVIVKNGSCDADTSAIVKVGIRNLWTGTTNTDWNTSSNWSNEALPDNTCPSVIVPVVTNNQYPSITAGTVSVQNLDVKAGASLTVNNAILKIAGIITSTNGIDATNGTITLNGSSVQTIAGAHLKNKTVKNLTIENNVTLTPSTTDSLKISGTLGFGTAANKTFAAGTNSVVLLSSLTNTANVPNIGTNHITGSKFTVERYINTGTATAGNPLAHGRAWQLLSVPTSSTQKVHDAWQEGQGLNVNGLPGYGALLNGPVAQGGYDNNSAGTYIKSYIPGTDQWNLGTSPLTTNIATNRGWMTFVMGDRSSSATVAKPTVLRTTGSLITGTQTPVNIAANKYDVVGNPYASEIDLRQLVQPGSNLTQEVYVWDPTLGAGYGFGRYRTLTFEDGDYYTIPSSANYPEISNMIQSGQAFFVRSNGQGPSSVTFTESVKANNNHLVTRGGPGQSEKLKIDLFIVPQGGEPALLDGAVAFFKDEYSIAADEMDGIKLMNSGENVGFRNGARLHSVERRPSPLATDTLHVEMSSMKVLNYNWEIKTTNMEEPGRSAWLLDNYLNTKTPLALNGSTIINFDVTATPASAAANRFKIIFSKVLAPLPVTFTGISASRNADRSIAVKWSVENELNLDKYTIERSADGVNFNGIITAEVTNSRNYGKNDLSPLAQDNYYRIKATSLNGQIQYSAIVKVAPVAVPASISVYPNPVENKRMNISFVNQANGTYQLQVINDLGQIMYNGDVKVTGNNDRKQVSLLSVKAAGRYTLKVIAEDGTTSSIKLLVQ